MAQDELVEVTQADIALQREIAQLMVRWGAMWPAKVQEALARYRIASERAVLKQAAMIVHEEVCNATHCYRIMRRIRSLAPKAPEGE